MVEIGQVILEKKMKMLNVFDNDDNDDDRQRKTFDQKSSFKPSAFHFFIRKLKKKINC